MQQVEPSEVGLSSERLERVRAWLEQQVELERVAGASVCIGREGKSRVPRSDRNG